MNHLPSGISALLGKGRIHSVPNPPPPFFFFCFPRPKKTTVRTFPDGERGVDGFCLKKSEMRCSGAKEEMLELLHPHRGRWEGKPEPPPPKKEKRRNQPQSVSLWGFARPNPSERRLRKCIKLHHGVMIYERTINKSCAVEVLSGPGRTRNSLG